MSSAFLIIDAQTGYARPRYHSVRRMQEILPDIRAQMPVIWVYMAVNNGVRTDNSKIERARPENYSDLFNLLGSNEPLLEPHEEDWFSSKNDINAFKNNHLVNFLKDRGIDDVDLAGHVDSECVCFSGLGGLRQGFNVRVLTDLTGREESGAGEKALARYQEFGIPTGLSRDFL